MRRASKHGLGLAKTYRTDREGKQEEGPANYGRGLRPRTVEREEDEQELREQEERDRARKERREEMARESKTFGERYQERFREIGDKIFFIYGRRVTVSEWNSWQHKKRGVRRSISMREGLEKQRSRNLAREQEQEQEQDYT